MKNHWKQRKEEREEKDMEIFRKNLTTPLKFPKKVSNHEKKLDMLKNMIHLTPGGSHIKNLIKFDVDGNPTNLLDIVNWSNSEWSPMPADLAPSTWCRSATGYLEERHALEGGWFEPAIGTFFRRRTWGKMNIHHTDDGNTASVVVRPREGSLYEIECISMKATISQEVPIDESAKNAREANKKEVGGE